MRQLIVLIGVAAGLYVLYMLAYVYVTAFIAIHATPMWWRGSFSADRTATLWWLSIADLVGLILVSIPFALAIDRLCGRVAVRVALGVATITWITIEAPFLVGLGNKALYVRTFQIAASLELLGTLPIIVWLIQRLPSNYRIERPRGP